VMPSSETEARSRGRLALDRDGASLEGASGPRARQNLTEGASSPRARQNYNGTALYPSSGAEFRPRVARPII
jgi:hypothetical protein